MWELDQNQYGARVDIKIKMTNNIYTNLGRGHRPKYLILCNRTLDVITLLIKIDRITVNLLRPASRLPLHTQYVIGTDSADDNIEYPSKGLDYYFKNISSFLKNVQRNIHTNYDK